MGIEYMIDLPCRPKKEMGEDKLMKLVKTARENAPKKSVGTVETAQILEVPSAGGESAEAKLRKEISELDYYLSDCFSCPANAAADKNGSGPEAAFGCHMEIGYPIRAHMESALLSTGVEALQRPEGNPGHRMVMGVVRANPKGKKTPANRVRRMGREYYESKAAKAIKVEVGGSKIVLDSDQLMTLLMLGPVPVQATGGFAIFLDRGIERSKREGISDPRVLHPLVQLSAQMKAAREVGKQVKVTF
jgi:hypothetical protein